MTELVNAQWPGNVRELKNVLRRSLIMSTEGAIECLEGSSHPAGRNRQNVHSQSESTGRLLDALKRNRGRLAAVANELNVSVRTVQRRLKENGLRLKDFRRL